MVTTELRKLGLILSCHKHWYHCSSQIYCFKGEMRYHRQRGMSSHEF